MILPTPVIFSCIFGVIVPNGQLPKCTKTRVKSHKIAFLKCPKIIHGWGSATEPTGVAYIVFYRRTWGHGRVKDSAGGGGGEARAKKVENHWFSTYFLVNSSTRM